ncbi:DNA damage-inducible transcript 3 protein [Pimephales promelas]|uniref:DNA damage-inducible transcript 3 protein n=1 Tax=Pimephales promelas TaxID=90988 RepID=UPI0019556098|nr:DNA damage-inducible transcript 3 protein [Pimephales promelas]KAG1925141.1 DNA damage-inducible transcript 3 protein [Pimephales promelas]KAG1925142.1 DNA damage-inducible transcript 3 protein [Pimephales promelas]KAG1925143.1 DNA damage-inducible transcript 3 protein [Pimephales promelas]KAG1925145.1 DNA damage-inducible transcript 3 protein [Pimephales promelas]
MTAEWLYPPGVGPLCGAELEAWYEDLQDILGSDGGGAKLTRAPPCSEKEPEFLDVLESCSLTWLTEGQVWGDGVQRVTDDLPSTPTPPRQDDRRADSEHVSSGGDLLPPEFFELLSEGGVGSVETMVSGGYHLNPPSSPAVSEEELPTVPDTSSCSSASRSPSLNCSPPASPPASSRPGKRKRSADALCSPSPGKKSRREREQENERKVQELTDQNERLKAEIERLGEEVQRTRRALIERLVNTRR